MCFPFLPTLFSSDSDLYNLGFWPLQSSALRSVISPMCYSVALATVPYEGIDLAPSCARFQDGGLVGSDICGCLNCRVGIKKPQKSYKAPGSSLASLSKEEAQVPCRQPGLCDRVHIRGLSEELWQQYLATLHSGSYGRYYGPLIRNPCRAL